MRSIKRRFFSSSCWYVNAKLLSECIQQFVQFTEDKLTRWLIMFIYNEIWTIFLKTSEFLNYKLFVKFFKLFVKFFKCVFWPPKFLSRTFLTSNLSHKIFPSSPEKLFLKLNSSFTHLCFAYVSHFCSFSLVSKFSFFNFRFTHFCMKVAIK